MEIKQKEENEKLKIKSISSHKFINFDYAFKLIKIVIVRSILAIIIGLLISFYVIIESI